MVRIQIAISVGPVFDDFLIELALAGNAMHIVTNNTGDLRNAELSFPGLAIVKPERLLRGE